MVWSTLRRSVTSVPIWLLAREERNMFFPVTEEVGVAYYSMSVLSRVESFFVYRYAWRWGFPPYNRLTRDGICGFICGFIFWYCIGKWSLWTDIYLCLWRFLGHSLMVGLYGFFILFGGVSEIRSISLSNIAWCRSGQPHYCWELRYFRRVTTCLSLVWRVQLFRGRVRLRLRTSSVLRWIGVGTYRHQGKTGWCVHQGIGH